MRAMSLNGKGDPSVMSDGGLIEGIVGVENKLWISEGLRGDVVFGHKRGGDIKRGGAAIQ